MDKTQIIEALKSMTILEINELVKALEEEFGVSAVAVAAPAGGAAAAEEEHDHEHDHEDAEILTTTGAPEKETGVRDVIRVILIVLEVIISIVLIIVVLLQSGKEAGLSGALSGNNDSYLSKNGGSLDKKLAKSTKWVALAWIIVTLALALI